MFKPQCKTRADLYREMARVLDMCEAAGFEDSFKCVKIEVGGDWEVCESENAVGLRLTCEPDRYEFALAIVEGRPVFRDSEMYRADNGLRCRWDVTGWSWQDEVGNWQDDGGFSLTWNPPKPKTITVNGVEVKAPDKVSTDSTLHYWVSLGFGKQSDAEAFKAALEGESK